MSVWLGKKVSVVFLFCFGIVCCVQYGCGVRVTQSVSEVANEGGSDTERNMPDASPDAAGAPDVREPLDAPVGKDASGPKDESTPPPERMPLDTPPDARPIPTSTSIPSVGAFQEPRASLRLPDGALAVLVRVDGKASIGSVQLNPVAPRNLYLVIVNADGTLRSTLHLFASQRSNPGDNFVMADLGGSIAISTLGRTATLDPAGIQFKMVESPQGTPSYVFRVDLKTNKVLPSIIRIKGSPTVIAGTEARWFIGGSAYELEVSVGAQSMTRTPARKRARAYGSNGFVVEVNKGSALKQLWMLDGVGESGVSAIVPATYGLYVVGTLGGYGKDMDGIFDFGRPTEVTLTSESSRGAVPAHDTYIARLGPSMRLKWARLVVSSILSGVYTRSAVSWDGGVALSTVSAQGIIASKGTSDERKEPQSGLLMYSSDGKLKDYYRISGVQGLSVDQGELIVFGRAIGSAKIGKDGTLPGAQSFGGDSKQTMNYILRLNDKYERQSLFMGAWMKLASSGNVTSWLQSKRAGAASVWLVKTLFNKRLIVENGGTAEQSFGKEGQKTMVILKWELAHKTP